MLEFEWNALRVGDHVLMHDDAVAGSVAREGVVRLIQTREGQANEVAIRLDEPGSPMLRPRRHAVHMQPLDRRYACWRCDQAAA